MTIIRALLAGLLLLIAASPAAGDNVTYPKPSLRLVLVAEGGYSNHPNDRGGVTLEGVIQRVYDADRDMRGLPRRPLTRAMQGTPEWIAERDNIYRRLYWEPCAGPALPRGVDFSVFTMCVNAGIVRGWSMLMKVLGLVTDRPWSPLHEILPMIKTIGVRKVIHAYGEERRRFYSVLATRPGQDVFRNGWLSREDRERRAALNIAAGALQAGAMAMKPSGFLMGKAVDDPAELLLP